MKLGASVVSVAIGAKLATAAQLKLEKVSKDTPIARVVALINELEAKVTSDGKMEQASYDKYACWCEDTLARKAGDITKAKEDISDLTALIKKLSAEMATHGAEIANTKKMIGQNIASQNEATEARSGEKDDFNAKKDETENCLGALEAAIKALSGAGGGKGMLMQEAQVLSVVDGVRSALKHSSASKVVSDSDLQVVKHFVERPDDFMGRERTLSAVQIAQNPFGDYAPQSDQIQGILKGMHDAFTADLEKDTADEAESQKAFEELMSTKKTELDTLEATRARHESDKADKTKQHAESNQILDDTEAQLAADEPFFEETKSACKTKASMWAERTRLRTEELQGMAKAVEILNSPDAQATFTSSGTTLLQVGAVAKHTEGAVRDEAWKRMRALSRKFKNLDLAQIAADLKVGGHFDKVVVSIDKMIALVREEEQDDIAHRDRCQVSQNKNNNDMEDLASTIEKTDRKLNRLGDNEQEMKGKISTLEGEIDRLKTEMKTLLELRNKESSDFKQALQDDMDAVALISKATVALSDYYKRNKIPFGFVQKKDPTYKVDPDKAPETSWAGGEYGGRKSESTGIVAILTMIKEDTEIEIKQSRADDAEAQKDYLQQKGTMTKSLDAAEATKSTTETDLAELQGSIEDSEEFKAQTKADAGGADKMKESLGQDCSWVETHFATRRDKRKAELDGLMEAKNYLAGVEAGDQV